MLPITNKSRLRSTRSKSAAIEALEHASSVKKIKKQVAPCGQLLWTLQIWACQLLISVPHLSQQIWRSTQLFTTYPIEYKWTITGSRTQISEERASIRLKWFSVSIYKKFTVGYLKPSWLAQSFLRTSYRNDTNILLRIQKPRKRPFEKPHCAYYKNGRFLLTCPYKKTAVTSDIRHAWSMKNSFLSHREYSTHPVMTCTRSTEAPAAFSADWIICK